MNARAIAYTSDIILGQTGEVISRAVQKQKIERYAEDNKIEIVGWFEDDLFKENLFDRPGIVELLKYQEAYELVLVERVWCLSKSWKTIKSFLDELIRRDRSLESASWLWDCVSVLSRHHIRRPGSAKCTECVAIVQPMTEPVREVKPKSIDVSRPAHLYFIDLISSGQKA